MICGEDPQQAILFVFYFHSCMLGCAKLLKCQCMAPNDAGTVNLRTDKFDVKVSNMSQTVGENCLLS